MAPKYEIETEYGKVFLKLFDNRPDAICIVSENSESLNLFHERIKYHVVLYAVGDSSFNDWFICVRHIHQIEPEIISYTSEIARAEDYARDSLTSYFGDLVQTWVKNHPDEIKQALADHDQRAIDSRMNMIETLRGNIKRMEEEIALIRRGKHLYI
jgi:hypothetical protein